MIILREQQFKGGEIMHTKLLQHAGHEHLKEFLMDTFDELKKVDHEMYEELEEELYEKVYGCHFCDWLLEKATAHFHNEDGTMGPHWNVEQTTEVAKHEGISFTHFNMYDWNYVMNMIYSDFYGAMSDDVSSYVKMARKFLEDKDAPKGKAYHYYMAMKRHGEY
jgi:hypothetical protein